MIDGEWYIFVANPDYDDCDVGQGDACGGVTIAHLNFAGYGDLPRIVKVGEAEVSWETTRGGWIYIHDMTVQTGQVMILKIHAMGGPMFTERTGKPGFVYSM